MVWRPLFDRVVRSPIRGLISQSAISNSNWTEWSTIQRVIARVIINRELTLKCKLKCLLSYEVGQRKTFSDFLCPKRSSVGRVTVDLIRRSWVWFHRGQKIFSLSRVVPWFPLLGLTPSGLFMGSISTLIYTAEWILCFTICVLSATRHNIHNYKSDEHEARGRFEITSAITPFIKIILKSLIVLAIWLALRGAIYSRIAPSFALNRIFFSANERGTVKLNIQSDSKVRLKLSIKFQEN